MDTTHNSRLKHSYTNIEQSHQILGPERIFWSFQFLLILMIHSSSKSLYLSWRNKTPALLTCLTNTHCRHNTHKHTYLLVPIQEYDSLELLWLQLFLLVHNLFAEHIVMTPT